MKEIKLHLQDLKDKNSDDSLPDICWKVKGNNTFDPSWKPFSALANVRQLISYAPKAFRIARRQIEASANNIIPGRQKKALLPSSPFQPTRGVPLGGIGSGSIDRGFAGEFLCMRFSPGQRHFDVMHGCMFIVTVRNKTELLCQYVLSREPQQSSTLSLQSFVYIPLDSIHYYALYPRAWTVYDLNDSVKLTCRQVSPVIPHNYLDSSLPSSVFIWTLENLSNVDLEVSLTFCWQTGLQHTNSMQKYVNSDAGVIGILTNEIVNESPIDFGIVTESVDSPVHISVRKNINMESLKESRKFWNDLSENGTLEALQFANDKQIGKCFAVCNTVSLKAKESKTVKFALSWHMPLIKFGNDDLYTRYYTNVFKNNKCTIQDLLVYSLKNVKRWELEISRWQHPILNSKLLGTKLKWCMLNELYYLTTGGSIWLKSESNNHPMQKWGKFLLLEGLDLLMYNTYDVLFYASAAFIQLWPNIQLSVQYDFANLIAGEDTRKRKYLFSKSNQSKHAGRVPHDIGGPYGQPWKHLNAFHHADVNDWKDLNLKYIISVYRDYTVTKNVQFLKDMYEHIKPLISLIKSQDINKNGLIDNFGVDQTYDDWPMYGCSAYCGSLQLAALRCLIEIVKIIGSPDQEELHQWLAQACNSYDRELWNGSYYRFDSKSNVLMAAQLSGFWYLKQCKLAIDGDLKKIWSSERVHSILANILKYNQQLFMKGKSGVVNGVDQVSSEKWAVNKKTIQSKECWIGVTYAFASLLLSEKEFQDEGHCLLDNMIDQVWNSIGLAFQSPEAISGNKTFRSAGYMRPLSIWSIPLILNIVEIQESKEHVF